MRMDDPNDANVRVAVALLTAWLGDVDATTDLRRSLTIVLVEELGDGDPLEGALNLGDGGVRG